MTIHTTFAERFQLWKTAHSDMTEAYAGGKAESDPKSFERYSSLVSLSFERALDVLTSPALTAADVGMKRRVWEAEEGHTWGADEIRQYVDQMLTDAAAMSNVKHGQRTSNQ